MPVTGSPRSSCAILPAICADRIPGHRQSGNVRRDDDVGPRARTDGPVAVARSRKTSSVAPDNLPASSSASRSASTSAVAAADVDDVRAVGQVRQRATRSRMPSVAGRVPEARRPGSRGRRETRRAAAAGEAHDPFDVLWRSRVAAHGESLRRQRAGDRAADDAESQHARRIDAGVPRRVLFPAQRALLPRVAVDALRETAAPSPARSGSSAAPCRRPRGARPARRAAGWASGTGGRHPRST